MTSKKSNLSTLLIINIVDILQGCKKVVSRVQLRMYNFLFQNKEFIWSKNLIVVVEPHFSLNKISNRFKGI